MINFKPIGKQSLATTFVFVGLNISLFIQYSYHINLYISLIIYGNVLEEKLNSI